MKEDDKTVKSKADVKAGISNKFWLSSISDNSLPYSPDVRTAGSFEDGGIFF